MSNDVLYFNRNASCVATAYTIYIDGKQETTATSQTSNNANANVNGGGVRLGASDNKSLNGAADDFKIYNYARTPAQVAWEYNKGAPVAR